MGGKSPAMSRRLSKPQSKNSSWSDLLDVTSHHQESSSPMTSSDLDYFGDTVTVSSGGERRSKRKSRSKLREYLYGSSHETPQDLSSDEEQASLPIRLAGAPTSSRNGLSRSGSGFTQLSSTKTSALQLTSSSSSKLLTATGATESAVVAEQIKERAHKDSLAAQKHVSSPGEEDMYTESFFPPTRRKSLYTPGLATRSTSDILRKPPLPGRPQKRLSEEERNYYYNPSHSESSPLSRLAALALSNDGRSTPTDLNVTQLGGLRLGTLRVTNGTISPTLKTSKLGTYHSPTPSSSGHDAYHTASEGSGDEALPDETIRLEDHSQLEKGSTPTHREYGQQQVQTKPSPDAVNTLPSASSMAFEYIAEINSSPFSHSSTSTDQSFKARAFQDEAVVLSETQALLGPGVSRVPQEDAFDNVNGAGGPNETTQRWSVPRSQAAKSTVESDPIMNQDSGYNSTESNASDKSNGSINHRHSTFNPNSLRLEAFEEKRPICAPVQPFGIRDSDGLDRLEAEVHEYRPRDATLPSAISMDVSPRLARGRRLQKNRPMSQPPVQTLINTGLSQFSEDTIPRVPSAMALRHAERLMQFPALQHTYPTRQHVSSDEGAGSKKSDSTLVRFPSPASAIEAARTFWPLDAKPSKPSDFKSIEYSSTSSHAAAQPEEEEGEKEEEKEVGKPDIVRSPSWSAFGFRSKSKERKKLVKKAEEAKRRLEKHEQEVEEEAERDREERVKQLSREARGDKSLRARSFPRVRRKSTERRVSQTDAVPTLCDLGTVAESLGGSPYDIATNLHPGISRASSGHHPHQMSSVMQRPRSFVGMDDQTASELNRARSRARRQSLGSPEAPADMMQTSRSHSVGRSRPQSMFIERTPTDDQSLLSAKQTRDQSPSAIIWNGSEPRSGAVGRRLRSTSFNDRGGTPGRNLRPHSTMVNAPPVPSLPALRSVGQMKKQETVIGERPRSIATSSSPSVPTLSQSTPNPCQKAVQDESLGWTAQQRAWSERRKSAGAALMQQHRLTRNTSPEDLVQNHDVQDEQPAIQLAEARLIQLRDMTLSPGHSSTNCSVMGRYEGGLHFGYEPGCGLGGSAGTRGVDGKASRKSSHYSKGYGLDLSDVPIFVAATPK
ncbi:uncharacterized protein KY384_009149 [Bacidia gigantensis]|uniref:uncharacterized protein n=1 Tax=Bacidia gigantensis TaxID=2732470 RepID=UPI001D049F6E|nr:uncharacterized protein KY384_009149 [Bacidia gigantensis]KAG8525505.1 hypothetical protein KY384_009149 [Bacidia gigantensis]